MKKTNLILHKPISSLLNNYKNDLQNKEVDLFFSFKKIIHIIKNISNHSKNGKK